MTIPRAFGLIGIVCACSCAGSQAESARLDAGPAGLSYPDGTAPGAPDGAGAPTDGLAPDVGAEAGAPVDPCSAQTSDGIPLNPGCDLAVQSAGFSSLAAYSLDGSTTTWLGTAGLHWWEFQQPSFAGGQAQFVNGGKDLAAWLRTFPPACSVQTADGIPLNPGCDATVQSAGLSALGSYPLDKNERLIVATGARWWLLDRSASGGSGQFVDGGKDLAAWLRTLPPACSVQTVDGIPLNPGCDATVQDSGLSSLGGARLANDTVRWIVTAGTRWWLLEQTKGGSGEFVDGGKDLAAWLRTAAPDCAAQTNAGLPLNPGCHPDLQASGFSSLAGVTVNGKTRWLVSRGILHWVFEQTPTFGQFVAGAPDLAAWLRSLD